MRLSAICNSPVKLFGSNSFLPFIGTGAQIAQLDADFIKPALLYADQVVLTSGNYAFGRQVKGALALLSMPLRRIVCMTQMASEAETRKALIDIGAAESQMIPLSVARNHRQQLAGVDAEVFLDRSIELAGEYPDFFGDVTDLYGRRLAAEYSDIESGELTAAQDAGILRIEPYSDLDQTHGNTVGENYLSEQELEAMHVAGDAAVSDLIQTARDPLLLDDWALGDLSEFLVREASRSATAHTAGVSLLASLPTISNTSVTEIIDIRGELAGPLVRFRAAVSAGVKATTATPAEFDELLTSIRTEQVEPAVLELEELIKENSMLRTLFSKTLSAKELTAGASGLLVAAGIGGPLAPLGIAAASGAIAHQGIELWRRIREDRRAIATHPFYFLHRVREA